MPLKPLIDALLNGEIVITPTNRLQREILWLYAHQNHHTVYIQPQCFSYEAFLQTWLNELAFQFPENENPILLSAWQFYLLWKNISESLHTRDFNHFEIKQAISAYKNCALALSLPEGSDFLYTPTAELFQKIVIQIEKKLKKNDWIAPAKLANYLSEQFFPLPSKKITWAFFDCFHPQQEALLTHLSSQGITHHFFDYPQALPSTSHEVFIAEHEKSELEQLIAWVQLQLAQGKQRIGIVVPDLSQNASFLQKVLPMYLDKNLLHFSLGKPLFDYPIVKHALALLSLNTKAKLSKEVCKVLLLSPFIQEQEVRQHILQEHVFQEPILPFADFVKRTQSALPYLNQLMDFPPAATPHQWVEYFEKRLQLFGFPGSKALEEETHQVLSKFYGVIEQLLSAALVTSEITQTEVLNLLEKNCQEQIHQPPQNYHGVHVMGWLESSGFCGDALWICHFQSHLVPEGISLSPLLPIQWQKKHQLARTQRDKEFEMAERMLERFINAHAHAPMIISYAQTINQEPQWPSPLLPNWKPYGIKKFEEASLSFETLHIPEMIPYVQKEKMLKGGYQILASLAKCPFQAFANYRLHSKQSLSEEIGFNASERGRITHRVLQYLWTYFQDQNKLQACDENSLIEICLKYIDKTLQEFAQDRPYSLDKLIYDLERQQLLQTILPCLEFDKSRQYFKIEGLEEKIELEIDGWPFHLRYDRLDRLDNGDLLIIDYKSKLPSPLPWTDERPIHPQILLYAIANMQIRHLLFLGLQTHEFKQSGFGAEDIGIENLKVTKKEWISMQQEWLAVIQNLITEFRAGVCTPTPKTRNLCQHCHNRDICRQETFNETDGE